MDIDSRPVTGISHAIEACDENEMHEVAKPRVAGRGENDAMQERPWNFATNPLWLVIGEP